MVENLYSYNSSYFKMNIQRFPSRKDTAMEAVATREVNECEACIQASQPTEGQEAQGALPTSLMLTDLRLVDM